MEEGEEEKEVGDGGWGDTGLAGGGRHCHGCNIKLKRRNKKQGKQENKKSTRHLETCNPSCENGIFNNRKDNPKTKTW